ncbi:MAG: D-alanine--D-alanine ligase [Spirochaetes bacterium]|nr:D-alanine--D-alanine ligase [Spirochaetota bacterium]
MSAKRTIVVLYPLISTDAGRDDLDTLVQRDEVMESLFRSGYDPAPLAMTLNLEEAAHELRRIEPLKVFNLVESLGGHDRLLHLAPALLEAMAIPCTGSPSGAIMRTTDKRSAKREMRTAGLPTPPFITPGEAAPERGAYLVKSSWDHGSAGIDENSVVSLQRGDDRWHDNFRKRFRSEYFAERYIDGREFNISLIQGSGGPEVLPPAEMCFHGFRDGEPKIVGYRAKWDDGAAEYHNTVRRYDFPDGDGPLLDSLRDLSLRCWRLFELSGYARVDFRVDEHGAPWILEVNANPCLSSDAGFMAAAERASLGYDEAIRMILESE